MHAILSAGALLVPLLLADHSSNDPTTENSKRYVSLSRFTDPKDQADLLDDLPEDVKGIVSVVKSRIVHPDQLEQAPVPRDDRRVTRKVWPPQLAEILKALRGMPPGNSRDDRPPVPRVAGASISRSYFLAGLLRYRLIPARVRAGFLTDTAAEGSSIVSRRDKTDGDNRPTRPISEPARNKNEREADAYSPRPGDINRYAEHWTCECWDDSRKRWHLLEMDATRLNAHGDSDGVAGRHFEFAAETWKRMRRGEKIVFEEYEEGTYDYRSLIRARLLWDFASLLNHDLAGAEEPSGKTRRFVEEKRFDDLSARELREMDRLAELLLHDPDVDELVKFYRKSPTLRMQSAENDPYSYVFQ
jgi:hypothetical protein